ncbi:MAG: prolipoprotein diacylglyceryl transferase [Oscillospiraceae bacterium]|nr:prolipoprotein diacylglyceryl transferase [Oscillospiraceae bacterium]
MAQNVSFPALGLEFSLNRVAFTIGGFNIYWYGIILAAAFLVGVTYALRRVSLFGLDSDRAFDVMLVSIVAGVVGARLYYVAFTWGEYHGIIDVFSTRSGGLAIYGGLMGASLAVVIMCRIRRVKLLPMFDLAVGGIILGQAIGRWANFVNIEAFGSPTNLPWRMQSPVISWYLSLYRDRLADIGVELPRDLSAVAVHPTFLYESLWCFLGFGLIMWLSKRRRFDGQISLVYLAWYGAGRFFIEGLRTDSLLMGNARISQIVALLCVLAAGITLAVIMSKIRRENDPEYLKLYVDTEEGQAILAGEFYKKNTPDDEQQFPDAEDAEDAEDAGEQQDDPGVENKPEPEPQQTNEEENI